MFETDWLLIGYCCVICFVLAIITDLVEKVFKK